MPKKFRIAYNPYFHIPFLLWVIVGGISLMVFSKQQFFAAVNTHYNPTLDVFMYYITFMGQSEIIIPTLALLMFLPLFRTRWYFLSALVANITPLLIQQWLKRLFHAPRPLRYFHRAPWIHYLPQWGPELLQDSFPSGHSQGAFSFFCFLSLLLPQKYKWLALIFFVLALQVLYSRLYLAAHFFEDVYVGSIIGAVTTTLLVSLIETFKPQPDKHAIAE